jgi:hypothetical protein
MPNFQCTAAMTPFFGCRSPSVRVGSQISKCVQYEGALSNFLAAFTSPGNVVLPESLTYPGIKAAAAYTGVRLVGVPIDEKGTIPDELDSACRQHAPRAVYLIPTIHNPTTATMPLSRRKDVAEILRRHEVLLLKMMPMANWSPMPCRSLHSFPSGHISLRAFPSASRPGCGCPFS